MKISGSVSVIAEFKRTSPSGASIRLHQDYGGQVSERNILNQVQAYVDGGAVAISVLTERSHFNGSLDDLAVLKEAFPFMPFVRKDFIVSEYQVYESKAAGADALLLITQWLEDGELKELYELTRKLGMHALVEIETEEDFKRACILGAEIIGINARSMIDLTVDVRRVTQLARRIRLSVGTDGCLPFLIGESGVDNPEIIREWQAAGIDAVLVGSSLMKTDDPRGMVRAFSLV